MSLEDQCSQFCAIEACARSVSFCCVNICISLKLVVWRCQELLLLWCRVLCFIAVELPMNMFFSFIVKSQWHEISFETSLKWLATFLRIFYQNHVCPSAREGVILLWRSLGFIIRLSCEFLSRICSCGIEQCIGISAVTKVLKPVFEGIFASRICLCMIYTLKWRHF